MNHEKKSDLAVAVAEIESLAAKNKPPTRQHARAVLLALGERILEGDSTASAPVIERLSRALRRFPEDWARAVHDELVLACTEHIQSVDPRYLDLPRYDFEYTVTARERLEARLQAASHLDLAPSEDLLNRVARADALLEPYLRKRAGKPASN